MEKIPEICKNILLFIYQNVIISRNKKLILKTNYVELFTNIIILIVGLFDIILLA